MTSPLPVPPSNRTSALSDSVEPGRKRRTILEGGFFPVGLVALLAACAHPSSPGSAAVRSTPVSAAAGSSPSPVTPLPAAAASVVAAPAGSWDAFQQTVQPIMELHCYPCHSEERSEKDIRWDLIKSEQDLHARKDTLAKALAMLYADKMPPICAYPLSPEELMTLVHFIEARQKIDPPGPAAPTGP